MILAIAFSGFAQKGNGPRGQNNDFTPEQQGVLKTKKMALLLDLSQDQQDKLVPIHTKWAKEHAEEREMMKKLRQSDEEITSDQRFEHMTKMLDKKMVYQKEVQKILTKEQYSVLKETQATKGQCSYGKRNQDGRNRQDGRHRQGGSKKESER